MEIMETDLFPPLKEYFEKEGYKVEAEVKNCDIIAVKDGFLAACEIKKHFNVTLLYQAIDRQKFADAVYIAILKPKRITKDFSKMKHIAEALNIGFLCVNITPPVTYVDLIYEPVSKHGIRDNLRKRVITGEVSKRSLSINSGGVTKKKIATAYRERCIQAACIALIEGGVSAKLLKEKYGLAEGIHYIFNKNHYGWFNRISKGVYEASDMVKYEMENGQFKALFELYMNEYNKKEGGE